MRTAIRSVHKGQDGQMALTMILTLLIVFMFFAITFDAGVWYFDHRTAQNQTDAAAEAGVLELPADETGPAVDIALEWLDRNRGGSVSSCTVENGGVLDRGVELWSGREDGAYDRIRVCVSRDSSGFFGLLSGIDFATISAEGTAGVRYLPQPYTLMAFNPDECGTLDVGGQGDTDLGDGRSYTESDCDTALTVRGNGHLEGDGHDVQGCGGTQGNNAFLEPEANCGAGDIDDPLAHLDAPPVLGCPQELPAVTNPPPGLGGLLPPGEYCHDVLINQGDYVMDGIYIFYYDFEIQGNSLSVVGTEDSTLIYMTCPVVSPAADQDEGTCEGQVPGLFRVNGGTDATIVFHGYDQSDDEYDNVFLWVDRTAGPEPPDEPRVVFEGQKLPEVNGIVYAIASDVRVAGQNEPVFGLNMAIIGDTIDVEGQGDLTFTYELLIDDALRVYGLIN